MLGTGEFERVKKLGGIKQCEATHLENRRVADLHKSRFATQPCAVAIGTWAAAHVLRQLFTHGGRFGLKIAPPKVRQHAFKRMFSLLDLAFFAHIIEFNFFNSAAKNNRVLRFVGEFDERRFDVETVVRGEPLQHLKVKNRTSIPALDRTARERKLGMRDDACSLE